MAGRNEPASPRRSLPSLSLLFPSASFAVGGAGLFVSTVAVHRQLAAGAIPSCSAASASTAAVAAPAAAGGSKHLEGEDITVYQYKICPFCNKLKVVMDFLGIPYSVTEVMCVKGSVVTAGWKDVVLLKCCGISLSLSLSLWCGWDMLFQGLGCDRGFVWFPATVARHVVLAPLSEAALRRTTAVALSVVFSAIFYTTCSKCEAFAPDADIRMAPKKALLVCIRSGLG